MKQTKSQSPPNQRVHMSSSQRQSLTVKTQNLNHFDSRWAQIKITGKNIPNRSNHTSVIHGQYMYVHGGYDVDKGILSDFNKIDLTEQNRTSDYTWEELNNTCEGKVIRLKNHTAVTFKQQIILFGGQLTSAQSSNATYIYSVPKNSWSKLKSNLQLPGVDSHCVTVLDNKMYLYGGYIPSKAELMNDVYALDLETLVWERVYAFKGTNKQPEGRSNCAMVGYEKSLYVFGGSNGIFTLNDFWKFSLTTKQWEQIETANTPSQRRGHSMLIFQNYLFMFGGIQDITKQKNDVYIYEFTSKTWRKIHTTTNSVYDCSPTLKREKKESKSPDKLTLMRISPEKNSTGDAMKKILNENKQKKFQQRKKQLLKQFSEKSETQSRQRSFSPTTESMLKTLEAIGNQESTKKQQKQQIVYDETNRKIIGKKPCARDGQTICVKDEYMYIFGGDRHLMAFNDLYSFDLGKGIKSLELYSSAHHKNNAQKQKSPRKEEKKEQKQQAVQQK